MKNPDFMKIFSALRLALVFCGLLFAFSSPGQGSGGGNSEIDLLANLEPETPVRNYAAYTFKSTRIINTHSIENVAAGVLDFRIMHRFGAINGGWYELWGLDQAGMRMSLDYGVTPWLTVGGGRTNVGKAYDGFLKVKILRQSSGAIERPVSVSLVSGGILSALRWDNPDRKNYFTSRLSYYHQLLIARKVSEEISLQITPTLLHRNFVSDPGIPNDLWALGTGGRLKLSSRVSANLDYIWLPQATNLKVRNNLSLGVDIETGGHVFQLHVSNGRGLNEGQFIAGSVGNWNDGTVYFGFNLSRVFTVREPRELKTIR
jgi:hypothetical protein